MANQKKLSSIASELNVGLPNIYEFLRKNNVEIVESPNTRVDETVVEKLTRHFQPDREFKTRSEQQINERRQERATTRAKAPAAQPEVARTPSDLAQKPRILGKIELDSKGNPVAPKPEPKPAEPVKEQVAPAPKPEPATAPKPEPKPQPEPEAKHDAPDKDATAPAPTHEPKT
ncbi:MAG: hypothetical protein K2G07_03495, partial [Muribaculaceae bacterium]|nr:hypothetical protein [Muribaculaceae bacterium]